MVKHIFFFWMLFFPVIFVYSQEPQSTRAQADVLQRLKSYTSYDSRIAIHLDPRIEANYYRHIYYNQKFPGALGYQLRIFSGSGPKAKEEAERARALFLSRYEDIGAYLVYDTPDYKVYVGDCRTQSEAHKLFNRVRRDFPNAFQVSRRINVSYD